MRMSTIIGGVASSAVIVAMAVVYLTADEAKAAVEPKEIVYIERVVERIVHVPVPMQPRPDTKAVFAEISKEERHCLALNVYFESRGESKVGQEFVGWVTLNRVMNSDFPDTICKVVWQDDQFSWTHDGKSDRPKDQAAWDVAKIVAEEVLQSYGVERDPTEGATYFHATSVKPTWAKSFERVVRIDNHIFYADNG